MMSTINGGHYQPRIPPVRAASADGYEVGHKVWERRNMNLIAGQVEVRTVSVKDAACYILYAR